MVQNVYLNWIFFYVIQIHYHLNHFYNLIKHVVMLFFLKIVTDIICLQMVLMENNVLKLMKINLH